MKLKKLMRAGGRYLLDKDYRFLINAMRGRYDDMEDIPFLQRKFSACMSEELDLDHPETFNQKLQWLKLYDRDPRYTVMADKVAVKDYVAERIGASYVIPTLGVWSSADEIDFDTLPARFAIKCNHNSGLGMYICRDRSEMDIAKVKADLARGLRQDYYLVHREWPYKGIPRRILAETYLESREGGDLADYKIHCFNGVPRFILVCKDRFAPGGLTEDFFTPAWEHMDIKRPGVPLAKTPIPKPQELDEMLARAARLAENIPFVRVDLYCVDGKIYFSELTFFPSAGFVPFEPAVWDKTFGDWLTLPDRG